MEIWIFLSSQSELMCHIVFSVNCCVFKIGPVKRCLPGGVLRINTDLVINPENTDLVINPVINPLKDGPLDTVVAKLLTVVASEASFGQ